MRTHSLPVLGASRRQLLRPGLQGRRIGGCRDCLPVRSRALSSDDMSLGAMQPRNFGRFRRLTVLGLTTENLEMKIRRIIPLVLMVAGLAALPAPTNAQSSGDSRDSSSPAVLPSSPSATRQADLTYTRPSQKTKLRNYFFDALGPYPILGASFAAGISQAYHTPPEWEEGAEGYGKRVGSDFAIAAVSTTTRYALAQAFREDTLYYRCECKGFVPRLGHAMISTFTARRGTDGHRVFSFPALVAPYAGTMTAVYGWYPDRYNAKDALRMGNYSLLGYAGGNVALEFIYGGPHSWLSRIHLSNGHTNTGPTP